MDEITLEMNGRKVKLNLDNGVRSVDESWFEPSSFGILFSQNFLS
jgi:hypothetical protein